MRQQREQTGHIFEAFDAFHVRYWLAYNDLPADEKEKIARKCELKQKPLPSRVQKSKRLCSKEGKYKETTSKPVRDLAQKVMDEVNGLKPGEPILPELTLVDYWDKHYLPYIETNLKPSTVHGYKQAFNQHLKTHFGKTRLKDITTPMVTKMLGQLAKEDEQGQRTITHTKWIGSGIFIHAIATGFASSNPWPDAQCLVKTPRPKDTEAYSLEEALGILGVLDRADVKLAFALACFLGIRKGEICLLHWEDFLPDGRVWIHRAMSRNVPQDTTKNGKARMGLLIEPVKSLLQAWHEVCGKPSIGLLFPNGARKPMSLDSMAQRLIIPKLTKGLRWKGWHAGRRGLGTELRTLTGKSNAGKEVLGHATTQITEAAYEKKMPQEAIDGLVMVEARLKSLSKKTEK